MVDRQIHLLLLKALIMKINWVVEAALEAFVLQLPYRRSPILKSMFTRRRIASKRSALV